MGFAIALGCPEQPMTKVASTATNYYSFQFCSKGLFDIVLLTVNECFWETYGNNISNFFTFQFSWDSKGN